MKILFVNERECADIRFCLLERLNALDSIIYNSDINECMMNGYCAEYDDIKNLLSKIDKL